MEPLIELEHVSVARGASVVLHDVSLRVECGESVAILGPNGCGKSTLLKTMTCELYPMIAPGTRVRILGRERWDLTELKRRMGVVSPELPGRPMLTTTGFDAVVTGFFSSSTLWPNLVVTAAMRERAESMLLRVGGEQLRAKLVGEMSAGEQRRVMIARAMAGSSNDMLLLDEPSNALDIRAQHELRDMLRSLAQQGTAIVMITHHVADILPEMQRVVMMREGRIVGDGGKEEMLTGRKLGELFGVEISVNERDGWFHHW